MRAQLAVTLAIVASVTVMPAQNINALGQTYAVQVVDVARQFLLSEFGKHPERVHHISITFNFQVDVRGQPHNVKIVSKTRNAWAVDTARQTLSAAKFPPIPKKIVQSGADVVNIQGDFNADASR